MKDGVDVINCSDPCDVRRINAKLVKGILTFHCICLILHNRKRGKIGLLLNDSCVTLSRSDSASSWLQQ